jgi:hypothetical protein
MNTWTLEKIKNCEEIKFGTICRSRQTEHGLFIQYNNADEGSVSIFWKCRYATNTYTDNGLMLNGFHFYRPDGTEILPPEDKVMRDNKVKLYAHESNYDERVVWYKHNEPLINHMRRPEFDLEF